MGKRGPPRKPAALNKLNGNPGKRERAIIEPQFPSGEPECPEWLSDRAAEHWRHALDMMRPVPGMVTLADRDFLIQYATAWDDFYSAIDAMKTEGMTTTHAETGVSHTHPAMGIKMKAREQILRMAALLGFNPSSRSGKQFGTGPEEKDDPLTALLKRRGSNN